MSLSSTSLGSTGLPFLPSTCYRISSVTQLDTITGFAILLNWEHSQERLIFAQKFGSISTICTKIYHHKAQVAILPPCFGSGTGCSSWNKIE